MSDGPIHYPDLVGYVEQIWAESTLFPVWGPQSATAYIHVQEDETHSTGGHMYDTRFVDAICRSFEREPRNSIRANRLLDLLQAVVLEDSAQIQAQLGSFLGDDEKRKDCIQ